LSKRKVSFVADFFRKDILGGAESNDAALIKHLEDQGYEVELIQSAKLRYSDLVSNLSFFIFGNFVGLSEEVKRVFSDPQSRLDYIIYEHDHKYLKSRDPSKFKDFKAPPEQIINKEFYANARRVVVLSEVCKEVIQKNLNITNVTSIGTSLWTDKKLDLLYRLSNEKVNKKGYCVVTSNNPTKGSREASEWCSVNAPSFDYIGSQDEIVFLRQLQYREKLVFMPQVLETFCRLVAEAKMLDCKVVTKPKMLGMASEKEIWNLSGVELNEQLRSRVHKALSVFEDLIRYETIPSEPEGNGKVTVILNCYKRPQLLKEQITALQTQSVTPEDIWVWVNEGHHPEHGASSYEWLETLGIKVFKSNHNWKFFGRFAAAMLAKTKYIAMFDDDTLPGKDWLSSCLQTMKTHRGILGGVGCVLPGERYQGHHRVGWSNPSSQVTEVDLVGHAWFFEKEWMKYFWMEDPSSWENGEDIHFSYMAQKYGNIRTFVPPQEPSKPETMSSLKGMEYGVDEVATSVARNHEVFYRQRDEIVKKACEGGWKLIKFKGKHNGS
jgi:hypothetical protein